MGTKQLNEKVILMRIDRTFAKHRRTDRGKTAGYPAHLKALALTAIELGLSPQTIATVAGISSQSLTNWQTANHANSKAATAPPRELTVIKDHDSHAVTALTVPRAPSVPLDTQVSMQIHLCSGVRVDLPVSAFTSSLFELLNGGAK